MGLCLVSLDVFNRILKNHLSFYILICTVFLLIILILCFLFALSHFGFPQEDKVGYKPFKVGGNENGMEKLHFYQNTFLTAVLGLVLLMYIEQRNSPQP